MSDIIERLEEESLRLARLSFETASAGIAANVVDEAIDEIKRLREALVLAEDILSRAPFSTCIWPNGMHPQKGIGIIRAALSFPSGIRKSES